VRVSSGASEQRGASGSAVIADHLCAVIEKEQVIADSLSGSERSVLNQLWTGFIQESFFFSFLS